MSSHVSAIDQVESFALGDSFIRRTRSVFGRFSLAYVQTDQLKPDANRNRNETQDTWLITALTGQLKICRRTACGFDRHPGHSSEWCRCVRRAVRAVQIAAGRVQSLAYGLT